MTSTSHARSALFALTLAACAAHGSPAYEPSVAGKTGAPAPAATGEVLVVQGGVLYTMDSKRPRAEMAVMQGGRFICVGPKDECSRRVPDGARVIDLAGGSATPGLADAHGHVVAQGRTYVDVSLLGAESESACVERLALRAHAVAKGAWVVGHNWDHTRWVGQKFPSEKTLTLALPDNPVFTTRVDGHAAWVNARALELAGITKETKDPAGGQILRAPDGRPTGVLVDNAQDLVTSKLPALTPSEVEEAILAASKKLLEVGVTSVHDAGADPATMEVYRRLATEGRLPIRVYAMLDGQAAREALDAQMALWKKTPEIGMLTVRGVKLYADGAMGSGGALMSEPYSDNPKNVGLAVTEAGELRARILDVAKSGYQPAVHAIGDRACAETLADFVEASKLAPDLRPRVEHLQVLLAKDVHLLLESRAVASMQPTHATSDGPWAEARLGHGTARQKGAYAWRQVLDAGAPLACGSDFPVEDIDPRAGLYSAETRRWPGGPPGGWMPEQRLTRDEAVRCFTSGAAFAEHAEGRRGMIREGYDADLTVFARDLFAVSADELKTLEIRAAIVGGGIAFLAPGLTMGVKH